MFKMCLEIQLVRFFMIISTNKAYIFFKKIHLNQNFVTQWEEQYSAPSIDNEYYWDVALSKSYGNTETFSPPYLSLLPLLAVQEYFFTKTLRNYSLESSDP